MFKEFYFKSLIKYMLSLSGLHLYHSIILYNIFEARNAYVYTHFIQYNLYFNITYYIFYTIYF